MKAVVLTDYGGPEVLQLREVPTPVPKANEVLVRIHAAAVTMGDCEIRSFRMAASIWLPMRLAIGLTKPRGTMILGTDFAGVVEAVGEGVTRFRVGERVFGSAAFGMGAHAEFVAVPEDGGGGTLATMPPNLSFEEAASAPLGGMMVSQFLKAGEIQAGKRVLIIGAGGSIGTYAVQAARHAGALVTAVDSTVKMEMLRALGAERAIDYTREDYAAEGLTYDVVFSVAGNDSYNRVLKMLSDDGIYLLANLRVWHLLRGLWTSALSGRRVRLVMQRESEEQMRELRHALEEGTLKAVVDRTFPLEQTAEAHRYVDAGLKRGSVVVLPGQPYAGATPSLGESR